MFLFSFAKPGAHLPDLRPAVGRGDLRHHADLQGAGRRAEGGLRVEMKSPGEAGFVVFGVSSFLGFFLFLFDFPGFL